MQEYIGKIVMTLFEDKELISFDIGKINLAMIMNDDRVSPSWCVTVGHDHGWKNDKLRFTDKESAIKNVLALLGVKE